MVFHVLNRGVGRMRLFLKDADLEAFERTIEKTLESRPMRICAYCLMSNHWHFVLWPERDGDLGAFMQKLTITHVRNWQENRKRVGYGHLYQGRYKSFPVESDDHFYQVVRYAERNALRANLVPRAEDWRWPSLWRRFHGAGEDRRWLSKWPLPRPRSWPDLVNQPQTEEELEGIRRSVIRGQPFGSNEWVSQTAKQLGLESTLRSRGRPRIIAR
jgi:putative transposase